MIETLSKGANWAGTLHIKLKKIQFQKLYVQKIPRWCKMSKIPVMFTETHQCWKYSDLAQYILQLCFGSNICNLRTTDTVCTLSYLLTSCTN
jgi:hypothetical protein